MNTLSFFIKLTSACPFSVNSRDLFTLELDVVVPLWVTFFDKSDSFRDVPLLTTFHADALELSFQLARGCLEKEQSVVKRLKLAAAAFRYNITTLCILSSYSLNFSVIHDGGARTVPVF